jgi:hypothetical protein
VNSHIPRSWLATGPRTAAARLGYRHRAAKVRDGDLQADHQFGAVLTVPRQSGLAIQNGGSSRVS